MKFYNPFSKLISTAQSNVLFDDIIGYDHIKRLFRMALHSNSAVHILLVGPPASAKTLFLTSLTNLTKAGMIDYLFSNSPRYLLIDEIDKTFSRDQAFLLNLMETGIISETKFGKTRRAQTVTSVFATCNNTKHLSVQLLSRFLVVELEQYTYEQFCDITVQLLSNSKIEKGVASAIANAVWTKSQDIRDCVKIGSMAKNISDVEFLVDNFFGHGSYGN